MALHWKIVIGLVLGLLFGFVMTFFDFGPSFVSDWIQPFGTIFVRLLKLIAIPLILASLVKGIADLKDISKFKNMGIRTFVTYMITTLVAILIGLSLVIGLLFFGSWIEGSWRLLPDAKWNWCIQLKLKSYCICSTIRKATLRKFPGPNQNKS